VRRGDTAREILQMDCPTIVPVSRQNRASRANSSQVVRSEKVKKRKDFTMKIEVGREASFRLDTMQGATVGAWLLRFTQISLNEEA
jgi:hypothetical protein